MHPNPTRGARVPARQARTTVGPDCTAEELRAAASIPGPYLLAATTCRQAFEGSAAMALAHALARHAAPRYPHARPLNPSTTTDLHPRKRRRCSPTGAGAAERSRGRRFPPRLPSFYGVEERTSTFPPINRWRAASEARHLNGRGGSGHAWEDGAGSPCAGRLRRASERGGRAVRRCSGGWRAGPRFGGPNVLNVGGHRVAVAAPSADGPSQTRGGSLLFGRGNIPGRTRPAPSHTRDCAGRVSRLRRSRGHCPSRPLTSHL
jgi:hypothetical protein